MVLCVILLFSLLKPELPVWSSHKKHVRRKLMNEEELTGSITMKHTVVSGIGEENQHLVYIGNTSPKRKNWFKILILGYVLELLWVSSMLPGFVSPSWSDIIHSHLQMNQCGDLQAHSSIHLVTPICKWNECMIY